VWEDHFTLADGVIWPVTPIARMTVEVLRLNDSRRVAARKILIVKGLW
jgi:hypothetical protein